MYKTTAAGGQYWTSQEEPRWTDWRGRQAFKYRHVARTQTVPEPSH